MDERLDNRKYVSKSRSADEACLICSYYPALETYHALNTLNLVGGGISQLVSNKKYNIDKTKTGHCTEFICARPVFFALRGVANGDFCGESSRGARSILCYDSCSNIRYAVGRCA